MSGVVKERLSDGANVTLNVEQEWINVSTAIQPMKVDPEWTWTDPAGHKHDASLKKTVWKVVRVYWCETCRDEHEESDLVCRYCGAKVEPDRVPDYDQPDRIPGLTTATLEVTRASVISTYLVTKELLEVPAGEILKDAWVAKVEAEGALIEQRIDHRS